jgi:glycosyltransferase involved in cell wall biosynthesis
LKVPSHAALCACVPFEHRFAQFIVMARAIRNALRHLQKWVPPAHTGFTILAYHLVGAGTRSPIDVPTDLFEAQLDSLSGRVCSLDDALSRLEKPPAAIDSVGAVLTFDDAYANFYEQVYPRLLERRLPAILYVPTGFVDRRQAGPIRGTEGLAACDWEQLRTMAASGLITLGSHTVTHPNLTQVENDQANWELSSSRSRIEEMTGRPVRHFCYPRGLWSRRLEPLVGREYNTAVIGGGGTTQIGDHPLRLQRISIRMESARDLRPLLSHRVWLEERASDLVRRVRPRTRSWPITTGAVNGESNSGPQAEPARRRLLYVVTHGMSARLLLQGQLRWMQDRGLDVAVAAAAGADLEAAGAQEGITVFPIPLKREIDASADLHSLVALLRLMRQWRPDIVNASTPKAGLLGMLAARAAGVPVRVYMLRGLRLETADSRMHAMLRATERAAAACAHRIIAVSTSLARRYLDLGLASPERVTTLGAGSSNGVKVERFANRGPEEAIALRSHLGIAAHAPVIGFVGRFTKDKGIVDLVQAFDQVRSWAPDIRLLLVGDFESGDPVPEVTAHRIHTDPAIVRTGFVSDAAPYYGVMDILAFPSYREGFPNAPLEAAAAARPVVGYSATGTVDAIQDSVTGALVALGDVAALSEALRRYVVDPRLRAKHGMAGRARVQREFRQQNVWEALYREYARLLTEKGLPLLAAPAPALAREVAGRSRRAGEDG